MRLTSSSRSIGGATAALLLVAACRGDLVTRPAAAPLAPVTPALTLIGAVGTPIFPTAAPGEQLGGDARGLNRRGQVTGAELRVSATDDDYKPYRWTPGSIPVKLLGCCDLQWGNDINDAGTVVGTVWSTSAHFGTGFVATGTSMTALPLLPGADPERTSGAMAINNAGQIVGIGPSGGGLHAILWSPSLVPRDLGTLGGLLSAAIDVNDAGQVIGYSDLSDQVTLRPFFWSASTGIQDLTALIGPGIEELVEINDAGQIIGSFFAPAGEIHAFLYTPGSGRRDLGTLGGTLSFATGLNARGDVVGMSELADRSMHAFLWTAAEGMEDITALTGVPDVGRLNDNLQTLTGFDAPTTSPHFRLTQPRLVQLHITRAPVARFTFNCVDRAHPHQCQFDASTSTDDVEIVSYAWDWGNGRHEAKKKPLVRNTWPKGGSYLVTLTVTDAKGQANSTARTVQVP